MKFKALAGLAAGSIMMSSAAMAADLPAREPAPAPVPVAAPIFTWTGFYVGVNGGYAFDYDHRHRFTVSPPATAFNFGRRSDESFFIGAQAGYNYQFGSVVVGLEGDIQYTDLNNNRFRTVAGVTARSRKNTNWFGTIRPRVGFAFNRALIYVTGGLAFGEASYRLTAVDGAGNNFRMRSNDTRVGYVLGGGVEYAFTNNLTAKLEYQYIDLGNKSHRATVFNAGGAPNGQVARARTKWDFHTIRVGLNYKF